MKKMKSIGLSVVVCTVALGIPACDKNVSSPSTVQPDESTFEDSGRLVEKDTQKSASYAEDETLSSKVRDALGTAKETQQLDIRVETQLGIATLQGSVESKKQKADVGAFVAHIEGVSSVNNQLVVTQTE